MFYEAARSANWFARAARSANWFARAARSANTPADRSKRATQLSPGAALPALCLLCSGRLDLAQVQDRLDLLLVLGRLDLPAGSGQVASC